MPDLFPACDRMIYADVDMIFRDDLADLYERACAGGELVAGGKPGRTSDEDRICMMTGGMPVEDVAWGKVCYDNAVRLGLGTKLKLWDRPDMC